MDTNHNFKPVYSLASVIKEWEKTKTGKRGSGCEWMADGQQSGGGGSRKYSADTQGDQENESRRAANAPKISGNQTREESWQRTVTDGSRAADWRREDEFRLGDGETGEGNILRQLTEMEQEQFSDDV